MLIELAQNVGQLQHLYRNGRSDSSLSYGTSCTLRSRITELRHIPCIQDECLKLWPDVSKGDRKSKPLPFQQGGTGTCRSFPTIEHLREAEDGIQDWDPSYEAWRSIRSTGLNKISAPYISQRNPTYTLHTYLLRRRLSRNGPM
jgi:hypothetical protein